MSAVIKEIKNYPPADRLRMILMIVGTRAESSEHDELLTLAFDAIRILERTSVNPFTSERVESFGTIPAVSSTSSYNLNESDDDIFIDDSYDSDDDTDSGVCSCDGCANVRAIMLSQQYFPESPQDIVPIKLDQTSPVGPTVDSSIDSMFDPTPLHLEKPSDV